MTQVFPLQWPDGWPRRTGRMFGNQFRTTPDRARRRLLEELRKLGARNVVISTNQPVRQDGQPSAARTRIEDPGVAVYFTLKGKQMAMAQDLYVDLHNNMNSLALAVEAMRALERHGGGAMMERAFTGFEALPSPKSCWEILGIGEGVTRSRATIEYAYREKAKVLHPDVGGDAAQMAELNHAREEALRHA